MGLNFLVIVLAILGVLGSVVGCGTCCCNCPASLEEALTKQPYSPDFGDSQAYEIADDSKVTSSNRRKIIPYSSSVRSA